MSKGELDEHKGVPRLYQLLGVGTRRVGGWGQQVERGRSSRGDGGWRGDRLTRMMPSQSLDINTADGSSTTPTTALLNCCTNCVLLNQSNKHVVSHKTNLSVIAKYWYWVKCCVLATTPLLFIQCFYSRVQSTMARVFKIVLQKPTSF